MTVLRLILRDQLHHQIASLRDINIDTDIVLMEIMRSWLLTIVITVELRADDRFLCSLHKFATWANGRRQMRRVLSADSVCSASKPYAAGGVHIICMSNYSKQRHYKGSKKNGDTIYPVNYLCGNFLIRNRLKLKDNAQLDMMYRNLDRMRASKVAAVQHNAERFLTMLPKV